LVQADDQMDGPNARRVGILRRVLLLISVVLSLSVQPARAEEPPRRVLILSAFNYTFPATTRVIDGIQKRLSERGPQTFAIDAEFLDLVRVADPEHELRTAAFVREKYAARPPEVVIVVGGTALQFIIKYRDIVAPHIPVVFAGVSPATYSAVNPASNFTGMLFELDMEKTLALAEQLQPRASQLFLISGNSALEDLQWQKAARLSIERLQRKFETTYLFGLSFDALMTEVARIPADAIVIFLTFLIDGQGTCSRISPVFLRRRSMGPTTATSAAAWLADLSRHLIRTGPP
jgi:hypothetical protein